NRKARPDKRLTINVHVDGMRQTHDFVVDREGVWDKAVEGIKEGKRLGYYVCTNTTVFRETSVDEIEEMVAFLSTLDVDGILLSPGYHYEKLVEQDHSLFRHEIHEKLKRILELSRTYPKISSTPLFLEFAAGLRGLRSTPRRNPTST